MAQPSSAKSFAIILFIQILTESSCTCDCVSLYVSRCLCLSLRGWFNLFNLFNLNLVVFCHREAICSRKHVGSSKDPAVLKWLDAAWEPRNMGWPEGMVWNSSENTKICVFIAKNHTLANSWSMNAFSSRKNSPTGIKFIDSFNYWISIANGTQLLAAPYGSTRQWWHCRE